MGQTQSPLVGYNTNVRHKGKLYHIQTEDSGVKHPHVITHLFADGGRIIASRKTSYADLLGADDLTSLVRKLMQEQHKAIFIELRDCVYDDDDASAAAPEVPPQIPPAPGAVVDVDALERAAAARSAESAAARLATDSPRRGAGRYQQTVAATAVGESGRGAVHTESIFGGGLLQGKSLDEVILSYLSDDMGDAER